LATPPTLESPLPKRLAAALALAALLLAALPCPAARADELTPAKIADTKLMLETSGSAMVGKQLAATMTRQLVSVLRKSRPDISPQAFAVVEREITGLLTEKIDAPGGMLDRLVPLYAKTFTHAEIKDILAFYHSPAGQKMLVSFPALYREGQKIGQAYAKELGPEIRLRINEALLKEGVSLEGKK